MEHILGIMIIFDRFLLLVWIIVILYHLVKIPVHSIQQILTVLQRQSNELIVQSGTHFLSLIPNSICFLFSVIHLHNHHK